MMSQENKTPESFGDIGKLYFKKCWIWISNKPLWLKAGVVIIIILLSFLAARANLLGEPWYYYTKKVIPYIPFFDDERSLISVSLSYEIEDAMGTRIGKLGDVCYDGDRIYLSFKVNTPCWVSVFGVDSKGIYPIFYEQFSPFKVDKDVSYRRSFQLDQTEGNEIYYVIAAHDKFDFEEHLRPILKEIFPQGNSKGPVFSKYQINLPETFTQEFIYFKHLNH